jgi:hypothetical protein
MLYVVQIETGLLNYTYIGLATLHTQFRLYELLPPVNRYTICS